LLYRDLNVLLGFNLKYYLKELGTIKNVCIASYMSSSLVCSVLLEAIDTVLSYVGCFGKI